MSQEWLASLKAGDEVLVDNRLHQRIAKVDRITATQIVVGLSKFRRTDGHSVGSDMWNSAYLRPPTQADRDRLEAISLREAITKATKIATLPVLRAMYECTKEQP